VFPFSSAALPRNLHYLSGWGKWSLWAARERSVPVTLAAVVVQLPPMAKEMTLESLAKLVTNGFASADKKFTALAEDNAAIEKRLDGIRLHMPSRNLGTSKFRNFVNGRPRWREGAALDAQMLATAVLAEVGATGWSESLKRAGALLGVVRPRFHVSAAIYVAIEMLLGADMPVVGPRPAASRLRSAREGMTLMPAPGGGG
jgi:hypothetical protein